MSAPHGESERRGWHIGKDIPVALIFTLIGSFVVGVTGYNKVQSTLEQLTAVSGKTVDRLDALSRTVSDGRVPSELNAARISVLEANVSEIKARVADLERRR